MNEPVVTSPPPQATPVLGYEAIQRRRWERGVQWLAAIVGVAQLLAVLAGLRDWFLFGISLASLAHPNAFYLTMQLLSPLVSLVLAICALLLFLRVDRVRVPLIMFAWLKILLSLAITVYAFRYWGVDLSVEQQYGELSISIAADEIARCYPLLLLSAVLKRRDATRRHWSAAAIWWLTALAVMLAATPTAIVWIADFHHSWYRHTIMVFSVVVDGSWLRTIAGIGMIAGSFASLSAFGAVAWTLHRGAQGRWALMICAALWIVFAVGSCTAELVQGVMSLVRVYPWITSLRDMVAEMHIAAYALGKLAAWLAFPLAIRVALTLSDVRAKLERKPSPDE